MPAPGSILHQEAYALGKMLDHSAWQQGERKLPRGVTASDVDFFFDNAGRIIYGELSRLYAEWKQLSAGQRFGYENHIRNSRHCAVLCRHSVSPDSERPIDTRYDVEAFQIMLHNPDLGFVVSAVYAGNVTWQNFVFDWFDDPLKTRLLLFKKYWRTA